MTVTARKHNSLCRRPLFFLSLNLLTLLVISGQAQTLNLKPETPAPALNTPVITPASLLQMIAALAIVALILRFALPKLLRRLPKNITSSSGRVAMLDTTSTPYGHLCLVKAMDRILLLGLTPQNITLLCEWEDEKKPQSGPYPDADSAFQELLKKLQQLEQ